MVIVRVIQRFEQVGRIQFQDARDAKFPPYYVGCTKSRSDLQEKIKNLFAAAITAPNPNIWDRRGKADEINRGAGNITAYANAVPRIKLGMTKEEVTAILPLHGGIPPRYRKSSE